MVTLAIRVVIAMMFAASRSYMLVVWSSVLSYKLIRMVRIFIYLACDVTRMISKNRTRSSSPMNSNAPKIRKRLKNGQPGAKMLLLASLLNIAAQLRTVELHRRPKKACYMDCGVCQDSYSIFLRGFFQFFLWFIRIKNHGFRSFPVPCVTTPA